MDKIITFAEYIRLNKCPFCGNKNDTIETRRRNTSYSDESLNFITSCEECYQEDYNHFKEMWEDFYRGRL